MKIGPVDHEIALLNLKKRKKLTQAKYIARSACLPSGLKEITECIIYIPLAERAKKSCKVVLAF